MLLKLMQSEIKKTIIIAKSYVLTSMLLAVIAGSIVPLGLLFLLFRLDGESYFLVLFLIVANFVLVAFVIASTYRKAIKQSIQLYRDKIVFDQLVLGRTFEFGSDRSWTVTPEKKYWVFSCSKTGFIKKVPKSAFPLFKREIDLFY